MPCVLLAVPLKTVIGEKLEMSPQSPEVKVLLGDHSLLVGSAQREVDLPGSLVQMCHLSFTRFPYAL